MNWKNKNVLVTGAGGFVGSHLTERLLSLGANVKAFIRYTSHEELRFLKPLKSNPRLDIVQGDIRDEHAVENAVKGSDVIFHLAALVGIPYSYIHPKETVETNTIGTMNILLAAKDRNVSKIVLTSTSETYGSAKYVPIDENHPLQGQSPYSASKIAADKIGESFYKSYGMPIAIIRPFNVYGPRQSARAVIPTIICQALTKREVKLGNTAPTRDFTYVDDTVSGFMKIAESEKSLGEVINIGSGFEISVGDIAKKIAKLVGKDVKLVEDKQRVRPKKSEVQRLWCSNAKAKKLLGWKPTVNLDDGLKRTIKYISQNLDQYNPDRYAV